jgi:hypothetical protein
VKAAEKSVSEGKGQVISRSGISTGNVYAPFPPGAPTSGQIPRRLKLVPVAEHEYPVLRFLNGSEYVVDQTGYLHMVKSEYDR